MSLQINGSNSLEHLAGQLSQELLRQQNHVFQPQYIVTQTQGMNNWLKIKMAATVGIVANCKFVKPNDLVNEIYYKLGSQNKQALSPDILQWVLFTLLSSKEFQDEFRNIANYYTNDDVKRLALAKKVADLFDQYQIYRPEMIRDWNENTSGFNGSNGWQKFLWVKAKEILGESMPDKTVIGKTIIEALKQPEQQKKLRAQIPNIHVFGLSIITTYHVHIFYELAKIIDVTFHLLNPAPAVYWFEDRSEKQLAMWRQKSKVKLRPADLQSAGNPLLIGWGRVLQDTFSMFFESEEFLNQYVDIESPEPSTQTLLKKIQNDIFHNHAVEARNELTEDDLIDGSITVNACYTTAREVEVLYNYLVHLVDQKSEALSARDIVVMVSDIDAYAPYIKAVFNSAPYKFPFTIADESFTISDNLFSALQLVLALSEDNFKAEEVLQLLDSNYIRTRFSITGTDLIRKAVDKANIRFGIEGKKEDETIYVSWKNGIRRIMYGICMSGEEAYDVDGYTTYPLDIAEGEDSFELIRFSHFAEVLISTIEDRRHVRTITEWGEYIEQVIDKLIYQTEDNNDEDYQLLLRNLEKLYALNDVVKDKISFDVFKHSFLNSLTTETRSNAFASGGITFCSLIPMRSIPFKVVALLGLNFDKFPRKETRVSFNLMELEKRKGDRNVKENDKHLFLETLLSAQQYLYISYIGRNSKDNTVMPPSVLIDELIDYIQSGLKDEAVKLRETFVTTHPLHGFSHKYQIQNKRLYNYLGEADTTKHTTVVSQAAATAPLAFDEVSIEAFIGLFKNPLKAYYNNVLRIRYEQDNVLLPENEIFELDGLQSWQMKQDMLFSNPDELTEYRNKGVATGTLPLKNMADWVLASTAVSVSPLKELVSDCIGDAHEESMHVELELGDTLLKGKLGRIYDGKLLFISLSKYESKYLLEAYIRFLIAIAAGNPLDLFYISAVRNKVYKIDESSRSRKTALKSLQKLLNVYKLGHEEILMFYPDFNKSPADIESLTEDKFKVLVNKYLESEGYDVYLKKEHSFGFFDQDGVFEQYQENSAEIFGEAKELFDLYYGRS
ncbi:exodeoxyribonuclease V subunit gamma [Segetibacter aerophilus]|uniref:RecBCD enzyme subunit RecC n=1 Tax=Segetibacter aerophilus TaxID=670293 RepID=A0A512BG56_9BACT|nr:exodeoxyribonuclease V subunit gamma [Segetibacter aerophilus]GEO10950.1 RecBCD enzyme subunit RecC [Segetibacter aerophilus]